MKRKILKQEYAVASPIEHMVAFGVILIALSFVLLQLSQIMVPYQVSNQDLYAKSIEVSEQLINSAGREITGSSFWEYDPNPNENLSHLGLASQISAEYNYNPPSPPPTGGELIAWARGPYSGKVNTTITLNGTLWEYSGNATPPFSYSWSVPDADSVTGGSGTFNEAKEGLKVSAVFKSTGVYTATLTITDSSGLTSSNTTTISVSDDPDSCFLAGTKVRMADGSLKNIEDIKLGEKVKSFDLKTGEIYSGTVTHVFHHKSSEMTDYYMVINNYLRVTPNHYMLINNEWKQVGNAKIGDILFSEKGFDYRIASIEKVYDRVPTYDLEVEGQHNYFVNLYDVKEEKSGILVHNLVWMSIDKDGVATKPQYGGGILVSPISPVCCFPAGTKISMADGFYKNIEDVKVGDLVVSYDVDSDKLVYSRVNNTEIVIREGVYDINNGLISPTDDHPLFVRKPDGSVGWAAVDPEKSRLVYTDRNAVQLEVGDYLFTEDGKWVEIYSIVYHPGRTVTYTFGVDSDAHDYFANGYLVSNAAIPCVIVYKALPPVPAYRPPNGIPPILGFTTTITTTPGGYTSTPPPPSSQSYDNNNNGYSDFLNEPLYAYHTPTSPTTTNYYAITGSYPDIGGINLIKIRSTSTYISPDKIKAISNGDNSLTVKTYSASSKYSILDPSKISVLNNNLSYEKVKEVLDIPDGYDLNIMIKTLNGSLLLSFGKPYDDANIVSSYTRNVIVYPDISAKMTVTIFR